MPGSTGPGAPSRGRYGRCVSATLTVPARFCGPDDSGNGGWVCGSLAQRTPVLAVGDGAVEVTLRRPPPLDRELQIDRPLDGDGAGEGWHLLDGEHLVAESTVSRRPVVAPDWVRPSLAEVATEHYLGHVHHPFPHCFVCGTARAPGDGLRLFPGPVPGMQLTVAAPFIAPLDLADGDGHLVSPAVWAALDCPTIWPYFGDGTVALLGRMRAVLHRPVPVDTECLVVGRGEGADGRKRFASAGLYTSTGELLAASATTWLTIDP